MGKPDPFALDRRPLRAALARAADTYDVASGLQREIADQLIERLEIVRLAPLAILDLGCRTGYVSDRLARRYRGARVIGVDVALAMLRRARLRARWHWSARRRRVVCAEAIQLPFASASADLIVSNLALHDCQPTAVFAELRRVLRPGGMLMFTSLGPDTLKEMRAAWSVADARPHVHGFLDLRDIGDLLLSCGFSDPVVDVERLTRHCPSVLDVIQSLKRLGVQNAALDRARGLTGKRRFEQFRLAYEAQATERGIPVTAEIVYGHAWSPVADGESGRHRLPAEIGIPISSIRRRHD